MMFESTLTPEGHLFCFEVANDKPEALRKRVSSHIAGEYGEPGGSCRAIMACLAGLLALTGAQGQNPIPVRSLQVELPNQAPNVIRQSWPGIGCFFWGEEEFQTDGYQRFLDLHYQHSAYRLLTTSTRAPHQITEAHTHDQIKRAALYASERDMRIVMDLDVRLARHAFLVQHPEEMQELLRLSTLPLPEAGEVTHTVKAVSFQDHYTAGSGADYRPLSGRLVRIYSYRTETGRIAPASVADITASCRVGEASASGVTVTIPCNAESQGRTACVMAAFRLLTPDTFAPHLLEFQRGILRQYADVPLAGACKDEWGFPGRVEFQIHDHWFSPDMADAYAQRRQGRDLVRDLLLMAQGEVGRERERAAAINHWLELIRRRHGEIEEDFYRAVKEVFGPQAMVATHPTWWYRLAVNEVQKNGVSWWLARRDLAQTDEDCQFCVRTSLAKKWHSPLWFNMYYAPRIEAYHREIWQNVLAGGRVNFHPRWPIDVRKEGPLTTTLLGDDLLRADARIRMLNYISTAPKDCPVAVVFGLACAVNWAGPAFADYGLKLAEALWNRGYPADLVPTDEIRGGSLTLDAEGWVRYGPQRYAAVVLFQPEFERASTADFFRKASKGKTRLFRVGTWTADFDGQPFDGIAQLPDAMTSGDANGIVAYLQAAGIEPQSPPARTGRCRLLDGTRILTCAEKNVLGDPIQETLRTPDGEARFDAVGVAAVRFSADGKLAALAAGGLKSFQSGALSLELAERTDVALWRDREGQWQGVLQGFEGPLPESLEKITRTWTRLSVPSRYATESKAK